jgi:hypothetical protein
MHDLEKIKFEIKRKLQTTINECAAMLYDCNPSPLKLEVIIEPITGQREENCKTLTFFKNPTSVFAVKFTEDVRYVEGVARNFEKV